MEHSLLKFLQESLLVIWNERNGQRRKEAIGRFYAPDIIFFDNDAADKVVGHDALNDFMTNLLSQFPAEFTFKIVRAEVNHNVGRLNWQLGPDDGPPAVTGMDIVLFEGSHIKALYVFLDEETSG